MIETASKEKERAEYRVVPLFKSPVIEGNTDNDGYLYGPLPNSNNTDTQNGHAEPKFDHEHGDTANLELFYDLFFAANYTVFSEVNGVANSESLKAYIGYFSLLWITWVLVAFYDVRYLTDSIFERVLRAVHLSVMVGFAIVTPYYNPHDHATHPFRVFSMILCISRVALSIQYAVILWHVRAFKVARPGLCLQLAIHVAAALIYLAVTFSFTDENVETGKGYVAWYVVSAIEAAATLLLSNGWNALSLEGTKVMGRMTTMTYIILGDGVGVLAKEISYFGKTETYPWDSVATGLVTAAVACLFFVFLTYFDWKTHDDLEGLPQQLWTLLHYPVHLAMVLFIEGFVQFVVWGKFWEAYNRDSNPDWIVNHADELVNVSSSTVAGNMYNVTIREVFHKYPIQYNDQDEAFRNAIRNISAIDSSFWPQLGHFLQTNPESTPFPDQPSYKTFAYSISSIYNVITTVIFSSYSPGVYQDLVNEIAKTYPTDVAADFNQETIDDIAEKSYIVFQSTYIAAGCLLACMTLLTVVSQHSRKQPWPVARSITCFILSVPVCLLALLVESNDAAENFLVSSWPLPVLTLGWFFVVVFTYVGNAIAYHFRHGRGKKV